MRTTELKMKFRRVFAAIVPPDAVQMALYTASGQLVDAFPDARIRRTARDHHHITLKFIARADGSEFRGLDRRVREVCERIDPFMLRTGSIEAFRRNGREIFWCGVIEDGAGPERSHLKTIHSYLNETEAGRFTPHITIARARGRARSAVTSICMPNLYFWANEIVIFESHLSPSGPRYDVLARHRFSG